MSETLQAAASDVAETEAAALTAASAAEAAANAADAASTAADSAIATANAAASLASVRAAETIAKYDARLATVEMENETCRNMLTETQAMMSTILARLETLTPQPDTSSSTPPVTVIADAPLPKEALADRVMIVETESNHEGGGDAPEEVPPPKRRKVRLL